MSGYGGGFDGGGDTPSRGGSSDGKPRRNYDEQTLTPVTIKMVLSALGDPSGGGDLSLPDGRPLHMVKLVAAVRNHEERSTNIFIDVEDGTGFAQVKVWVNSDDEPSGAAQLRKAACTDHTYIRIVGQVRDFDGQRQIVANDVRPVSTGNELTYHLLEVAHSYERGLKMRDRKGGAGSGGMMMGMGDGVGYGIGNAASNAPPMMHGGGGMGKGGGGGGDGNALHDAVIQCIKTLGAQSDSGAHVDEIAGRVSTRGFSASDVRNAINHLSNEGLIYSTIDEDNYQYAE